MSANANPAQASQHSCRALIVEDSAPERMRLSAVLAKLGYQVSEASDGLEALAHLEDSGQPVNIVISDWRMPAVDGIELCRRIKTSSELAPYFILLTGQRTVNDLVAAMDAGADDFIAKPFAVEELRVRLAAGRRVTDLRESLCQNNRELKKALAEKQNALTQIRDDLAAAETLQRALLPDPSSLPGSISVLHYFRGASGVAGDAYNIVPVSENTIAFYLIDVSGHGIKSAMLSFYATQLLTNASKQPGSIVSRVPSRVAAALNERLLAEVGGTDYLTMIYGILNTETGHGTFCQAGHPNPFITSPENPSPRPLGTNGFAIGMFEHATYDDVCFHLGARESLVITSDGIFAHQTDSGQPLTTNHLSMLLDRIAYLPIEAQQQQLTATLNNFLEGQELEDDVSVMVIRRSGSSTTRPAVSESECAEAQL
ncbi:SpoIIE family protein phosphatase [Marinobacter salinisoli]|uniref:SpoIIE family protein phosphatase n=1 Tax=Marinobacter salinisoli TaxID=2769486 RepID=A0ABX7MS91_9GAMM|nr:SpoIIE family protein phosphatase [Marinobacter salinisoli]QSP93971.1 SpoIIE family protein phosphatase [Marinobacter salinisoli]